MSVIIGLTGGIGSGKSTVSAYLQDRQLTVVCADAVAHQLIEPGQPTYKKIVRLFGKTILHSNGRIDRKKLGAVVFQNPAQLKLLNSLVHPAVLKYFKKIIRESKKTDLLFLDVPLLFESGMDQLCDVVILISLTQKEQILRIKKRDNLKESDIKKRIKSQMSLKEKKKKAHYVIDNSGPWKRTQKQIEAVLNSISEKFL